MINKYKRKTTQATWDENTMKLAMEEARKSSVRSAAKKYNINLSTLQRHIKKGTFKKKLGRFTTVFTETQESDLLHYVFHMDNLFYGLTKSEFLELVCQYADANKISHPFRNGTAGIDWYIGFKARHPDLTLRRPEPTSIARARGFNKPQVERFFNLLEDQIDKHNIDATRLYNIDETGIQTTSSKPPRILSKSGKKQVGVISSTERGKLTTVVCCCNAAGAFIPPFMIFERKRMVGRLLDGAPPGTAATCTDNGWINDPTFLEWLRHFVNITRPTPERKILLIMDNHESHKYLEALEYASKNNVIFVSLAPHTTHRMQPLDKCVYGPLKIYFEQAISVFQRSHVGRIVSQYEVARLFGEAYLKAASSQNAVNGFSSSGIWPTNRNIFDDSDFLPSMLTDRPEPTNTSIVAEANQPASNDLSETVAVAGPSTKEPDLNTHNSIDSDRTVSPTILDEIIMNHLSLKTPSPAILVAGQSGQELTSNDAVSNEIICKPTSRETSTPAVSETEQLTQNFTSIDDVDAKNYSGNIATSLIPYVTPMDIRPSPKTQAKKTTRKRRIQKAEVLTSTPIKEEQKAKELKRNAKELKKNVAVKRKLTKDKDAASSKTVKKKEINSKKEKIYRCLICSEPYKDPPQEDWIKCDDCQMWAHEACSSYSGIGSYYCDMCQE